MIVLKIHQWSSLRNEMLVFSLYRANKVDTLFWADWMKCDHLILCQIEEVCACSVVSSTLPPHEPTRLLFPWNFTGKDTGVAAISCSKGREGCLQIQGWLNYMINRREREERKGKERRKGIEKEKKEGGREGLNECVWERESGGVYICG